MDLMTILESGASFTINVSADDLRGFGEAIAERVANSLLERLGCLPTSIPNQEETYIDSKETMKLLGICNTTLCSYNKKGILCPSRVGGKNAYAKSEVLALLSSNRKHTESVAACCKHNTIINTKNLGL